MHEPMNEHLEDYLGRSGRQVPAAFTAHLDICAECRRDVEAFEEQSRLLSVLRSAVELRPGFYARVLERIDQQKQTSFWGVFLEPAFGRRLAVASAALALLMGFYLVSTEPGSGSISMIVNGPPAYTTVANEDQPAPVLGATREQDRNAVLVNLATYEEQ